MPNSHWCMLGRFGTLEETVMAQENELLRKRLERQAQDQLVALGSPARPPRIEMVAGNPFFVIREAIASFSRTSWPWQASPQRELRLRLFASLAMRIPGRSPMRCPRSPSLVGRLLLSRQQDDALRGHVNFGAGGACNDGCGVLQTADESRPTRFCGETVCSLDLWAHGARSEIARL